MTKHDYKFLDAVLAVTYICNSRCTMCNIWKIKDLPKLEIEDIRKLPSTLTDVNISGGEPFLRPDLPELIQAVRETAPKAKIIISSNGFATALIKKKMEEIIKIDPNIGVALSIDGLAEKHDEVRRIPNGFNKIMDTYTMLQELGVKRLRIGFTAGDYNVDSLPAVYKLSRDLGCEMTLAVVHNSENFFQIDTNTTNETDKYLKNLQWLAWQEIKTLKFKRFARAYFAYGMMYFLKYNKRILPSYGGRASFFLDPNGVVYPSDIATHKMGNIKDYKNFDELMKSNEAQEVLDKGSDVFDHSWMICTARVAIRKHPFKVGMGLVKFILRGGKV